MSSGFAAHTTTPQQLYTNFISDRQFDDSDIKSLGLELLPPEDTYELLGHTKEWSVKLPYYDLQGQLTGFNRVRLLAPKSKMKYSQARATGSHIYFPPGANWKSIAQDVDIPIIITEGEFKAYQLLKQITTDQLLYAPIGLAGVTSWTDKSGLPLHKDLMKIAWHRKTSFAEKHRKVYIVFDYDGAGEEGEPNEQVGMAETKLAVTLRGLGAVVHLCRVGRFGAGKGSKYAIDDHLLGGGELGSVLTATSVVMNGVDTMETKLYEFKTQYALFNGDVIRLKDGLILNWNKAKIDSAQHFFTQVNTNSRGNVTTKDIPLLDEYKKWPRCCKLEHIGMYPEFQGLQITPDKKYNLFKNWAYEPIPSDPSPYLDFCAYFFQSEPSFVDYWHDWVANVIQYPWRRNNTTPQFIHDMEGMGKSAIPEFVAEMMGLGENSPAATLGPDDLFSSFNGGMRGKIFVVVNEPSSDREDHSAKLKNLITGKEITINNKYGAQYTVKNYVNYVFTSNKPYITHMGASSRREAIYKCPTFSQQDILERVSTMMKWARANNGAGFSAVLDWYMSRDVSDFDPYAPAPMTKYKQKAIELSKSPLEAFAKELTDWTREHCKGSAAFTATQLSILCERWGYDAKAKTQYIRRALESQGEVEPSKVIKVHGKTSRFTVFVVTPRPGDVAVTASLNDIAIITEEAIKKEIEL
tara:strand:- start:14603 stop:16684 length:2082 start_codon:yes stop_codon:yes gene_type:complete